MKKDAFHKDLRNYLQHIESEFREIPDARIETLRELGDYVISSLENDGKAQLVFICTHNSRRSQFGQLWAITAARCYGVRHIQTFSGGTGSTAFNPRAVAALVRAGFQAEKRAGSDDNPQYSITSGKNIPDITMYSKRYDDEANPDSRFCAIMVCTEADEACPVVPGAEERISIPYDDPKYFDDTTKETAKYDERCRQFAREMFYLFHYVKTSPEPER